jgi:hypothetical protein
MEPLSSVAVLALLDLVVEVVAVLSLLFGAEVLVDVEPHADSQSEQIKINTNESNPYLLNCLLFILPVPFFSLLAFTESISIKLASRNGVNYDLLSSVMHL